MTMPSMTTTLLLAAALLTGIACNDPPTGPAPPARRPTVWSVTVAPSPDTLLLGSVVQLKATTKDSAGNVLTGRVVTWASSNTATATVSGTGLVTGLAAGAATITATSEGQNGTAAVTTVALVFAAVSAGASHTCGVTTGSAAYCWGSDFTPAAVSGGLAFQALSVGRGIWDEDYTCGVTSGGATYCWGYGYSPTPVPVADGYTFSAVSAGADHTCGVTTGGAAYCWGDNFWGELGTGTTTNSSKPMPVAGGYTFSAVSAGAGYTCGVTTGGAAYCWGYNGDGELGNGTSTGPQQCGPSGATSACSSTPVAVAGAYAFVTLSAGDGQTCGVTTGGAAYCWGYNGSGELGTGSTTSSSTPLAVVGGHTFSTVSATGLEHTCGVTTDGAAYCWGDNYWGELGTGTTTNSSTPVPVLGGHTFVTVSGGGYYIDVVESGSAHTCGVTTGGVAYCWGSGRTVPVKVAGQP